MEAMRAFGRYVPPQVVQGLLEGSVPRDLGMVPRPPRSPLPSVGWGRDDGPQG